MREEGERCCEHPRRMANKYCGSGADKCVNFNRIKRCCHVIHVLLQYKLTSSEVAQALYASKASKFNRKNSCP